MSCSGLGPKARSFFHVKPGADPSIFCADIDRKGRNLMISSAKDMIRKRKSVRTFTGEPLKKKTGRRLISISNRRQIPLMFPWIFACLMSKSISEQEVLVKIHTAGVNPLDNMIIRGEVKR